VTRPQTIDVLVEVPRGSFLKRELSDGALVVDYVSPLPSPFNYGCVPDTLGEDGDPLDVVVLGPRLPAMSRVSLPVVGVVRFVDAGRRDDKIVASAEPPTAWQRRGLEVFFRVYARARPALNVVKGLAGTTRFEGISWY
jgi:inorganic pyrophosphatase